MCATYCNDIRRHRQNPRAKQMHRFCQVATSRRLGFVNFLLYLASRGIDRLRWKLGFTSNARSGERCLHICLLSSRWIVPEGVRPAAANVVIWYCIFCSQDQQCKYSLSCSCGYMYSFSSNAMKGSGQIPYFAYVNIIYLRKLVVIGTLASLCVGMELCWGLKSGNLYLELPRIRII